jgi:hypothetical protein
MEKVTAEAVKEHIKSNGTKRWKLHNCSMCGYPCGYIFSDDGSVDYDSGCDCVSYGPNITPRNYGDLAETLNMQTPEIRERMWKEMETVSQ